MEGLVETRCYGVTLLAKLCEVRKSKLGKCVATRLLRLKCSTASECQNGL